MKTIKISNCLDCPHIDHDGALREGGAFWVCSATPYRGPIVDHPHCRRLNPDAPPVDKKTATIRAFDGTIPPWCPLT